MTRLDRLDVLTKPWRRSVLGAGSVFLRDVGHGLLEVSHNSLALLGLVVLGLALFAGSRPDIRHSVEAETLSWLQAGRMHGRRQRRSPPPSPT